MSSLQGCFLVASPRLPDVNFYQSVVLMVHHNEQGALGVVLNRPSNHLLAEIWEQLSGEPCDSDEPIYIGGPVEGPVMAIHGLPECSEDEIISGVYFASDRDHLKTIVGQAERPFRIFNGYSGWAPGQLENELAAGGWLTTPATDDIVFSRDDEMWKHVAGAIGLEILSRAARPKHVPNDVTAN